MKKIKHLIFENSPIEILKEVSELDEVAKSIQDASSAQLALSIVNSDYLFITLYEVPTVSKELSKAPPGMSKKQIENYIQSFSSTAIMGQIVASKTNEGYLINTVAAKEKYGPLLYEILSSIGGWIIPGYDVSKEASAVWKKFYQRDDVEKQYTGIPRTPRVLGYRYQVKNKVKYSPLVTKDSTLKKRLSKNQISPSLFNYIIIKAGREMFSQFIN